VCKNIPACFSEQLVNVITATRIMSTKVRKPKDARAVKISRKYWSEKMEKSDVLFGTVDLSVNLVDVFVDVEVVEVTVSISLLVIVVVILVMVVEGLGLFSWLIISEKDAVPYIPH